MLQKDSSASPAELCLWCAIYNRFKWSPKCRPGDRFDIDFDEDFLLHNYLAIKFSRSYFIKFAPRFVWVKRPTFLKPTSPPLPFSTTQSCPRVYSCVELSAPLRARVLLLGLANEGNRKYFFWQKPKKSTSNIFWTMPSVDHNIQHIASKIS